MKVTAMVEEALGVTLVHPDILAVLPLRDVDAIYGLLLAKYFAALHAHVETFKVKVIAAWHTGCQFCTLLQRIIEAGEAVDLVPGRIE